MQRSLMFKVMYVKSAAGLSTGTKTTASFGFKLLYCLETFDSWRFLIFFFIWQHYINQLDLCVCVHRLMPLFSSVT